MNEVSNKQELHSEINQLQSELRKAKGKQKQLEQALADKGFQLRERNKELGCLYQITELINDPDNDPDFVLQEAITILSASYIYPEFTCGRILYGEKEYVTDDFKETEWKHDFQVNLAKGKEKLTVEIYYLKEIPSMDNGPFLKEEKNLLETVGRELATYLNRKQAEEETNQTAQQLESVFNSLQDAIFIHDYNGNMLEVNQMACEKLKYSKDELLRMTPMDIDDPEYAAKAPEIFKKMQAEGHYRGETVHLTKTGERIPAEINANTIVYNGQPAILTIARDITERKNYEENLLSAKEKAEESTNLKSAFLANLSHEIRTPLNAILGFSDLMNHEDLDEEKKKEFIAMIKNSGQKLLSIMDDILDMSFIDSNQVQIEKQTFSLNNLIDDLIADTNIKIENTNENITCKSHKSFDEGNDFIVSDHEKIKQVYDILINNALKFTNEGTIEVGYKVNNSEYLDFYVSDTGVGIPYESKELVFERFRQVDQSITRQYEGLGLGLSIASGLVKQLGGNIDFESELNAGTTFTFTIPAEQEQVAETEDKETVPANDFSDKTILVAEDDIMNFLLVREFLIDTDADVQHAENGQKAVDLCKELNNVDLVIMDIKMPVLDGIEALKKIKKQNPNIPIIAFTAHAYEKDKQKLLKQGFDEYISKPVKQKELLEMMGNLI
ncbi:MAG: PAS domain-containing hybrid sensor histidine kinase/response regulator [Bacteroidota bacterium]